MDAEAEKPVEIELRSSEVVCAGAVAAYLCKSVANRAGSYAPGISETVFSRFYEHRFGRNLEAVGSWFGANASDLTSLGYRLVARRVAFRTAMIEKWVAAGEGYRAAVLLTEGQAFHQKIGLDDVGHAVGLIAGTDSTAKRRKKNAPSLQLIDPWPLVEHKRLIEAESTVLERAHRARKYGTVLIYWAGFS